MARFREMVLSACWLIPTVTTFYFWVVALVLFSGGAPSISPSPPPTSCDLKAIQNTMSAWISWMTAFVVSSVSMLYDVRQIVETAAAAEAKGNSFEEEVFRAAQEELKEAIKAVEDALDALAALAEPTSESLDRYVNAIGVRNVATAKAARLKPKEGLARLPIGRQRRVRLSFSLAVLLFFAVGFCAAFVLYLSQRLQYGCHDGAASITPFVLVGIISLLVHLHVARGAFTED